MRCICYGANLSKISNNVIKNAEISTNIIESKMALCNMASKVASDYDEMIIIIVALTLKQLALSIKTNDMYVGLYDTDSVSCSCKNTCQRVNKCLCKVSNLYCTDRCSCGTRQTSSKNKVNYSLSQFCQNISRLQIVQDYNRRGKMGE